MSKIGHKEKLRKRRGRGREGKSRGHGVRQHRADLLYRFAQRMTFEQIQEAYPELIIGL